MTVREGGPPGGLLRWLLFDDINHPRYAKFIGDFAKAMRPESFLPGHFDFSVSGKIVKPAFSFFDLLRIEHQRKAGVAGFSLRHGIAHHDVASGNAHVGMSDGGIGKLHSGRAVLGAVLR